jgi:hypothetical protein
MNDRPANRVKQGHGKKLNDIQKRSERQPKRSSENRSVAR